MNFDLKDKGEMSVHIVYYCFFAGARLPSDSVGKSACRASRGSLPRDAERGGRHRRAIFFNHLSHGNQSGKALSRS